jgi:hypothetical protein
MGDFLVLFATGIPLGLSRKKDKKNRQIEPPAINSMYKKWRVKMFTLKSVFLQ